MATQEAIRRGREKAKQRYHSDPAYREFVKERNRKKRREDAERASVWERNSNWRKFGLEPNDYFTLLAKQGGCCAICRSDNPRRRNSRYFHVDHCHVTNKVRGLLCNPCNLFLGFASDSVDVLWMAVKYLKAHE